MYSVFFFSADAIISVSKIVVFAAEFHMNIRKNRFQTMIERGKQAGMEGRESLESTRKQFDNDKCSDTVICCLLF